MELAAVLISAGAILLTMLGIAYAHGRIEARIESKLEVLSRTYGEISQRMTRLESRVAEMEIQQRAYFKTRLQSAGGPSSG